jgi:hypothetical protein
MNTDNNRSRIGRAAYWVLGGLGFIALDIALEVVENQGVDVLTRKNIPSIVAAAIIGTCFGGIIHVARGLNAHLLDAQRSMARLSRALDYQERALNMLVNGRTHGNLVAKFIRAAIWDKFNTIPFVNEIQYLEYLQEAIAHSTTYQGVQRNSVRWFLDVKQGTSDLSWESSPCPWIPGSPRSGSGHPGSWRSAPRTATHSMGRSFRPAPWSRASDTRW